MLATHTFSQAAAPKFCERFISSKRPKYVFGRNVYGPRIVELLDVDGFVDDFTADTTYSGRPILRTSALPHDALVLIASGARPLTARRQLRNMGIECLDYFAFRKISGLDLLPIVFNEGFDAEFARNKAAYERIYARLADAESRATMEKLVNFKLSYDLDVLEGFTSKEDEQYFESFLPLRITGETFVDVGAFDGQTSLDFARRYPGYKSLIAFEPHSKNAAMARQNLTCLRDVHLFACGTGDFTSRGSSSGYGPTATIVEDAKGAFEVRRIDDCIVDSVSFIKIDTEGMELSTLRGAAETIRKYHPSLAVAAYHRPGDYWQIPEFVLSVRPDYQVFLRHYPESIYETIMYFIPPTSMTE